MNREIKINFKKLRWARITGCAMAVILVGLAGFWWRSEATLATLKVREQSLTSQTVQLTQSIAALDKLKASNPELLKIVVPRALNVAQILTESQTLASSHHVVVTNLLVIPSQDPSPTSGIVNAFAALGDAANLRAYPIDVTVIGTKISVLSYVQSLTAGPNFTTITSVQFSLPSADRMQAVIAYDVYAESN